MSREEMARVLCPGGVAIAPRPSSLAPFRKPWPKDIDEWTHWLHGADGNPVSHDTTVGLPRRMQWVAPPRWSRDHEKSPSLTGMVSARGRLFFIADEAPPSIGGRLPDQWRLVARDAFNGVLLWKRPVPDWGWQAWSPKEPMNRRWGNPRFIHRRLVAAGDRVFVTLGYRAPVSALNAATGDTIRVYDGTEDAAEILYDHGVLYLSIAAAPKDSIGKSPPHRVMAVEADDGTALWSAGPFPSIMDRAERGKEHVLKQGRLMIAVGAGQVVCVTDSQLLALDARTGKQAWAVERPELVNTDTAGDEKIRKRAVARGVPNLGALSIHDGRVYFTQPHAPKRGMVNQQGMTVLCLAVDSGRLLWRGEHGDWSYTTNLSVYAAGDLVWVHGLPREKPELLLGLDPVTGKPVREIKIGAATRTRHHHRCYRNKATERFLMMGKEGVEYVDLDTGEVTPHRWIRGMCLYGIMPANGLLYVPPQACDCNAMSQLQGYLALGSAGQESVAVEERRVEGPAHSSPIRGMAAPGDWPMYRRNVHRDCRASAVGPDLRPRWRTRVGTALSAPSVADGRVYLAGNDRYEMVALDAEGGDVLWRRAVGGCVDSAPTYCQGRLIFGCADGWVYCLRASDGAVVWRFCAAPSQRYVVDNGRLESVWPVHGSVVVLDDTVYALAGRSSYLDGGLRLWALDPATGEARRQAVYSTVQDDQDDMEEGAVTDLLVRGGDSLFLRHVRIDPASLSMEPTPAWGYGGPNPGPKGCAYLDSGQGFLDDTLFGRLRFRLGAGNE